MLSGPLTIKSLTKIIEKGAVVSGFELTVLVIPLQTFPEIYYVIFFQHENDAQGDKTAQLIL